MACAALCGLAAGWQPLAAQGVPAALPEEGAAAPADRPEGGPEDPGALETSAGRAFGQPVLDTVSGNPITQSNDAFGQQVGLERIGLYNAMEIRGFNPVDAGNVRIESLYFDQVNRPPLRLMAGSSVKVGLTTLGYVFPAPSGLVDFSVRSPDNTRLIDIEMSGRPDARDGFAHEGIAWDMRFGNIRPGVGLGFNGSYRRAQRRDDARARRINTGLVGSARVGDGGKVLAFASYEVDEGDEARPTLFLAGDELPAKMPRGRDFTQPWARSNYHVWLLGTVTHLSVGGFGIDAGVFYNERTDESRFADLMTGVAADGSVASRVIVADGDRTDRSISGEFRVMREFAFGKTRHQIAASLRGRDRLRRFGGARRLALGASTILEADRRAAQDYTLGPKNIDSATQVFYGLAYSGRIANWLSLDGGVSQVEYRKTIDFANPASQDLAVATSPIAWNAAAAIAVSDKLRIFGSITRGMEEADVAPDIATNRDEAPAAIFTGQEELVVSYAPSPAFTLLVGVFNITKPFYNLDPALRFRLLGDVINRGVEVSVVARPALGLTLVGGAVVSDPAITGEIVTLGINGPRPIGLPAVRMIGNVDWRLGADTSPLSLDAGVEYRGSRPANAANTVTVSDAVVVNLGLRYRIDINKVQLILRARMQNALNNYDWDITNTGGLFYSEQRRMLLQLNTKL